jgi:hypothetical protein
MNRCEDRASWAWPRTLTNSKHEINIQLEKLLLILKKNELNSPYEHQQET